jgi:hypothetical protein
LDSDLALRIWVYVDSVYLLDSARTHVSFRGGWIAVLGKVKGSFCGRIIWILIIVYTLLHFVNEWECGTLVRQI